MADLPSLASLAWYHTFISITWMISIPWLCDAQTPSKVKITEIKAQREIKKEQHSVDRSSRSSLLADQGLSTLLTSMSERDAYLFSAFVGTWHHSGLTLTLAIDGSLILIQSKLRHLDSSVPSPQRLKGYWWVDHQRICLSLDLISHCHPIQYPVRPDIPSTLTIKLGKRFVDFQRDVPPSTR